MTIGALGSLAAAAAPAPAPAPAPVPLWAVDKAASRLAFHAVANGQAVEGLFRSWDARIAFDPDDLRASTVKVVMTMSSAVTGDATRDQMLPTGDWFDVGGFARSTFTTSSISRTGPARYVATGTLDLRGVRRTITLPFTLTLDRDVATMTGSTTLNRTAFGVGQGQTGGPETVAPQVTVTIRLRARKVHRSSGPIPPPRRPT